MSFFDRLKAGISKTKSGFNERLNSIVKSFRKVDDEFFEELEEVLILSDMGYEMTEKVLDDLRDCVKENNIKDSEEIKSYLEEILFRHMDAPALELKPPVIFLIVGVNGVGKTTAIGKLANYYKQEKGYSVMLAAADTFRAAAAEQLSIWGDRTGARVIKYGEGADPAAVVFDAVDAAKHAGTDLLLVDTAGRLHNKKNLMSELEKIKRVIAKANGDFSVETLLVIDATTGQNAVEQAKVFADAVDISGIILTKLDGTAKGGIVCSVKEMIGVPVRFIGVGEGVDDLRPFDARDFAKALME